MPQPKYSLTEEHRAQMAPWADKWIANAMSTKPMDAEEKNICRENIIKLYEFAGLPAPRNIVFVQSPIQLGFVGGFASALCYLRNEDQKASVKKVDSTIDDPTTATLTKIEEFVKNVSLEAAGATIPESIMEAVDPEAPNQFRESDDKWFTLPFDPKKVSRSLGIGRFGLKCAAYSWRMRQGGNQWSAWDSFLSFFQDIIKLPVDYSQYTPWRLLSEHSGPRIVHPEFCIISDRPALLKVDEINRPHCDDGPFCRWRDGSALYAIHGVRVPAWLIEKPERLTLKAIDEEENAEVRRVMIDRYGIIKYLQDSGAELISEDDYGKLWQKEIGDDTPIVMVEMINSTMEPDGTFKVYFESVHPELRPLPPGHWPLEKQQKFLEEQKPQEMTARNAIASTFGMTGEEYVLDAQS